MLEGRVEWEGVGHGVVKGEERIVRSDRGAVRWLRGSETVFQAMMGLYKGKV